MPPIFLPTSEPQDWSRFVADPSHWKTGYSAKSLASCWHACSDNFPPEIEALLATSPLFASAEILLAIPEHKVSLPGAGKPSQTDLWVLARTSAALVSIAIEGKVNEPFGERVGEWLGKGSDNKELRLKGLANLLGMKTIPNNLRYQLLHRTASAILEARRFMAAHAIMLVHSFSQSDEWYADFADFVSALGATPSKGRLIEIPGVSGPSLHIGWARGEARFLAS